MPQEGLRGIVGIVIHRHVSAAMELREIAQGPLPFVEADGFAGWNVQMNAFDDAPLIDCIAHLILIPDVNRMVVLPPVPELLRAGGEQAARYGWPCAEFAKRPQVARGEPDPDNEEPPEQNRKPPDAGHRGEISRQTHRGVWTYSLADDQPVRGGVITLRRKEPANEAE